MPPLATSTTAPELLSAVPPVVALRTALKDLVDTSENIFTCFSTDSRQKTAKAAATALFKAVRELETFCNEHHDLLESSTAMRKLLGQVVQETEDLYRKCCEASSPPPSAGVISKLVQGLQSWRHQPPSMEKDIFKLVNDVNQCHMRFTSFTVKRVEKFLVAIAHSSIGQIIRTKGLIRPREDEDEEELRAEVTEGQLVQFMGSSSTTKLSMASSRLTADLIADMYIRLQVKVINESLMDLSAIKFAKVEEHMEEYTRPFQPLMARSFDSIDPSMLHDSVVTQALELQRILREGSTTMSIQEGAWEMVNLSIGLFNLSMFEEAANMGTWTVNLFRKLVEMDEKIYMPYLIHTLRHVTKYYQAVDNLDGAIDAIEESLRLSRKLVEQQPDAEELTVQLGGVLSTYAMMLGLKNDHEKGLEAINEATAVFERMSYRQRGIADAEGVDDSAITTLSDKALCDYARALHQKSYTLESLGRLEDAIDVEKKASQIMQSLCPLYPDSILETELAEMLYRLCHRDFRSIIPALQALFYAEECVMIYELFTEHDSKKYGQYLYSAYWEKATIHGLLDQTDDALKTWKKAADLAKRIIADQTFLADALYQACWSLRKLQRHDEAVTIRLESVQTYHEIHKTASVVEANGHYDLAVDFQLAHRYPEALKSAEEALAQYKILAANNPDETKRVAQAQTLVSHIHCDASDLELAYEASREAVRTYQSLVETRADHIAAYVRCLRIAISIIYRLSHPEKSVGFGEEIVHEFKELIKDYPKDVGFALAEAMSTLSCILTDLKRPPEAMAWILQLIEYFEGYEDRSADAVGRHINALIDYASIIDCQGHSERALEPIEKAIKLGLDFGVSDATLVSRTSGAMFRRAHLCCEVGRYADALEIANETLDFVRKNNPSLISDLVGTLQVCVMVNHYNHNEAKAMEYAKEAVEVCRGEAMAKLVKEQIDDLCFLPNTLIDVSTCWWYLGEHAEAAKVAQEALDEITKLEPPKSALNPARWENTYFYALKQVCVTQFANGSMLDDKDILRVKVFSDERMKTNNGYTNQMAELLDTLQLYYCMRGRHEEGARYGKELQDLRARLHEEFPELARQVERELDWRRATSSWINILAKLDLKCGHYQDLLIQL
ncbi:unnamed protein product [Cyclocybe aegerita]|uniref:Uncharacterized protein n=1 Tax=Cyclocybe aegerita TaxID=1973307 RepID=A0A8S0WJ81_CYCAE|nr:unnamed protein product [Cyclocybe aegerita]